MMIATKVENLQQALYPPLSISGEWLSVFDRKIHSIRFVWPEISSVEIIHDARHAASAWSERDVTLTQ